MKELVLGSAQLLVWVAFFATSVYGHAALKLAVDGKRGSMFAAATSLWGISAFVAWTASGVLWMLVLDKQTLLAASSISSLRYVLICACGWVFWSSPLDARSIVGVGFVALGVYLVAR